ncbi:MAG: VWA domain-containing protein [Planctomycetes bacterium]|nr:VWA domain-containing protein [Planctomycetota bacterium]MCR4318228.1 VWA domain-containing protein [Planctomycetota bacterium]
MAEARDFSMFLGKWGEILTGENGVFFGLGVGVLCLVLLLLIFWFAYIRIPRERVLTLAITGGICLSLAFVPLVIMGHRIVAALNLDYTALLGLGLGYGLLPVLGYVFVVCYLVLIYSIVTRFDEPGYRGAIKTLLGLAMFASGFFLGIMTGFLAFFSRGVRRLLEGDASEEDEGVKSDPKLGGVTAFILGWIVVAFSLPFLGVALLAGYGGNDLAAKIADLFGLAKVASSDVSSFEFLSIPPAWATVLLIVPFGVLFILAFYKLEHESAKSHGRTMLAFIRVMIVASILFLIFQAVIEGLEIRKLKSTTIVLVDASSSMSVRTDKYADQDERDLEQTREILEGVRYRRLLFELVDQTGEWKEYHEAFRAQDEEKIVALLADGPPSTDEIAISAFEQRESEVAEFSAKLDMPAVVTAGKDSLSEENPGELDKILGESFKIRYEASERSENWHSVALAVLSPENETKVESLRERFAALNVKLGDVLSKAALTRLQTIHQNLVNIKGSGMSRFDIASELLMPHTDRNIVQRYSRELLKAIEEKNELKLFLFNQRFAEGAGVLTEITADGLDSVSPQGNQTRIGDGISEAVNRVMMADAEARIVQIIIISDGQNTDGADPLETSAIYREGEQNIRVDTVGVGSSKRKKDVEVLEVSGPREVIKGEIVQLSVAIRAEGFGENTPSEVYLCEGAPDADHITPFETLSGMAANQNPGRGVDIQLPEAGRISRFTLRFGTNKYFRHANDPAGVFANPPDLKPGTYTFYVMVNKRALEGEEKFENNYKPITITIKDRKIRVLYIDGPPRYDFRFLNEALRRDPNLEYYGFLTSANTGWHQPISGWMYEDRTANYMPLEEIPTGEGKELPTDLFYYDVIILGDVPPNYLTPMIQELLWRYVKDNNGGLIVQAGPVSMPGSYSSSDSYIQRLLPVDLSESGPNVFEVKEHVPQHYVLTPDGASHPALRLLPNEQQNLYLWNGDPEYFALPPFYWFYPTTKVKQLASVLVRHREAESRRGAFPLVSYHYYGSGLVFFIAVEGIWRFRQWWDDDQYFYPFWSNLIRFVSSESLSKRQEGYQLYTDKENYSLGEQVTIYGALEGVNLRREIPMPSSRHSDETILPVLYRRDQGDNLEHRIELHQTDGTGTNFSGDFSPHRAGTYEIWIPGLADSEESPHRFEVKVPIREFRDTTMNIELLRNVASPLGGSARAFHFFSALDEVPIASEVREIPTKKPPRPWWKDTNNDVMILAFVLSFLIVEWIGRKLLGLI